MAKYNAEILQKAADKIYSSAIAYAILAVLVGGGVGYAITANMRRSESSQQIIIIIIGAVVGGLIGWSLSFWIRLKAQQILCQKEVEQHLSQILYLTRKNTQTNTRVQPPQEQ